MFNFENLTKDELIDLLKAYDSYIVAAADSGRLKTGWAPVCIAEFYSCEYQEVWLKGDSFDYMYDQEGKENLLEKVGPLVTFNDALIFMENSQMMCRFDGEETKRFVRGKIQDIKDGDAFFVGTGLHYADGDAHQNMDEPDDPWIVYDVGGDCWFEEDIEDVRACVEALHLSQGNKKAEKPRLDDMIHGAENRASSTTSSNEMTPPGR